MGEVKQIDIKNRTYNFYNNIIDINPHMHKLGPWGPTLYIFGD